MQKDEQIFQYMKEEIEKLAQQQEDKILAEAKKLEEEAYDKICREAKQDADAKLNKDIANISSKASIESSANLELNMKTLVEKRDNYVASIFAEARQKLIDFVDSDEYEKYLLSNFEDKAKSLVLDDSTIYVRKEDLKYEKQLKKAYGKDVVVAVSDDIEIGGFILENKATNLVLDESLDFALDNQKDWFVTTSGLMIK